MERPLRVMLVGRHFWPHGAIDSAGHLMELATGLKLAGLHVSVATPKYSSRWAEQFTFREIDVFRPVRIFRTGWTARGDRSAARYIRYLREWLAKNSVSADLFYCDSAREEAIATVEAAKQIGVPAVIRISGNSVSGDMHYLMQSRVGKRCRSAVMNADAVVLGSATDHRNWITMGGKTDRAARIPIGIGPSLDQGLSHQPRLRRAMAHINGDLYAPDQCSVVLSVERLRKDSGVMTLVESAYSLSQKISGLQFWLIGDGPQRESIYDRLKGDGLRQAVAMPGSFGIADDVFSAADLMVHVGNEGFEHQIPTAIAAGLPLVVANTETAREFFATSENQVRGLIIERRRDVMPDSNPPVENTPVENTAGGNARDGGSPIESRSTIQSPCQGIWWFDPSRPKTLRFAIQQITSDFESARKRALQLRKMLQQSRSRSGAIRHYVHLFRKLANEGNCGSDQAPSMENVQ